MGSPVPGLHQRSWLLKAMNGRPRTLRTEHRTLISTQQKCIIGCYTALTHLGRTYRCPQQTLKRRSQRAPYWIGRHPMSEQAVRSRVGQPGNMSSSRPCYRHAAGVWMAYCPDCTAWYLPVQITRRNVSAGPRVAAELSLNLTAV
jgi:hypothetical protein